MAPDFCETYGISANPSTTVSMAREAAGYPVLAGIERAVKDDFPNASCQNVGEGLLMPRLKQLWAHGVGGRAFMLAPGAYRTSLILNSL
jgi:hypothetical protein